MPVTLSDFRSRRLALLIAALAASVLACRADNAVLLAPTNGLAPADVSAGSDTRKAWQLPPTKGKEAQFTRVAVVESD